MDELKSAIEYFEDAVRESDEIIVDCTPALKAELTEQKQHFVVALEVMRRTQPGNKPIWNPSRIMPDDSLNGWIFLISTEDGLKLARYEKPQNLKGHWIEETKPLATIWFSHSVYNWMLIEPNKPEQEEK